MPPWMKLAGLWSLAAIAALTLSWAAVSQVRDRVIQPATVIPTTVVALESEPEATVVVVAPETDDQPDSTTSTSTSLSSSASTSTTSTTRPRAPGSTSTTVARSSTTTAPTTTTTVSGSTTSTAGTNLVGSTHPTKGGTVTIKSGSGEVHFVSAIPQAGFTTELRETGPEKVRVRFVGASVIYEFEAEWEDGQLVIETGEHTP